MSARSRAGIQGQTMPNSARAGATANALGEGSAAVDVHDVGLEDQQVTWPTLASCSRCDVQSCAT